MSQALEIEAELEGLTQPHPEWFLDAMAVPRESGRIDVDGCPIHFLRWGDPESPGVVMVHGFLAHARCFAFIAPLLAGRFHVVAYDMSGFGDSGAREGYDDAVRAREMVAVADAAGMERPTLVAHSYGTPMAVNTLERFGDRFGGLLACDVLMHRPERLLAFRAEMKAKGRFVPRIPSRRHFPDLATGMSRFRLAPPQPVEHPFLLEYIGRHSLKRDGEGWTWKFDPNVFIADHHDDAWWLAQARRLVDLDARKAVVYGEQSLLFDADTAAYLRELGAGDLQMVGIPGARHHLMLDQPLAFADTLRGMLETWR